MLLSSISAEHPGACMHAYGWAASLVPSLCNREGAPLGAYEGKQNIGITRPPLYLA